MNKNAQVVRSLLRGMRKVRDAGYDPVRGASHLDRYTGRGGVGRGVTSRILGGPPIRGRRTFQFATGPQRGTQGAQRMTLGDKALALPRAADDLSRVLLGGKWGRRAVAAGAAYGAGSAAHEGYNRSVEGLDQELQGLGVPSEAAGGASKDLVQEAIWQSALGALGVSQGKYTDFDRATLNTALEEGLGKAQQAYSSAPLPWLAHVNPNMATAQYLAKTYLEPTQMQEHADKGRRLVDRFGGLSPEDYRDSQVLQRLRHAGVNLGQSQAVQQALGALAMNRGAEELREQGVSRSKAALRQYIESMFRDKRERPE